MSQEFRSWKERSICKLFVCSLEKKLFSYTLIRKDPIVTVPSNNNKNKLQLHFRWKCSYLVVPWRWWYCSIQLLVLQKTVKGEDLTRCSKVFFPLSLSCFENASQFGAVCPVPKERDWLLRSIIINWRNKLQDRFEWCRFHQRWDYPSLSFKLVVFTVKPQTSNAVLVLPQSERASVSCFKRN